MLPSRPSAVSQLRHRAAGFAAAAGASDEVTAAIALAVSETVTNVILHAYDGEDGQVRVSCQVDGERFIVEVSDDGGGIAPRRDSPGIGHGLAIVGALAQTLDFAPAGNARGTVVRMVFGPARPTDAPLGLEALCGLALETVADVSCVDVVREGVLRRLAAEVADDPALTAWLCGAVPPAKPGTATWAALREGGAHLVVHDPDVPRSPGGYRRAPQPHLVGRSPGREGRRDASRAMGPRRPRGRTVRAVRDGHPDPRRRRARRHRAPRRAGNAARSARNSASVTVGFWQLALQDCASGDATGRTWSA